MSPDQQLEIIARVSNMAEQLLADSPRCHDIDHTQRVVRVARHLAQVENGNFFIVECAAWLHDIGRATELADQGRSCHAAAAARQVPRIMRKAGLECADAIAKIVDCIASHRFRRRGANLSPSSIEAKILFDADKLDSMGAIGIGRAFHFAGRIGARVHNSEQAARQGKSYGREDTAFREYLVKLRYLGERLVTTEGKRIGINRCQFMENFFTQLKREVAAEDF